jgi:hypothetical protein
MPSYNKQISISTYTVDKLLIENLEAYFNKDILEILNLGLEENDKPNKIDLSVILHDSQGTETYSAIKEYQFQLFRNDINAITLNFEVVNNEKHLKLTLRFGKDDSNSDLSISLSDNNAREKISAITNGVTIILDQNKNLNRFFYLPSFIGGIMTIGGLFSGIFSLQDDYSRKEKFIFALIFFSIVFYFITINVFKHYSSFDTKKQKELDKWFNWLVTGLLGFLLFSTLLTTVRKNLFGF